MNRDLFLSILAIDSFNRGYGQRISGLPINLGTQIGSATFFSKMPVQLQGKLASMSLHISE